MEITHNNYPVFPGRTVFHKLFAYKPVTRAAIYGQMLDVMTTLIGIALFAGLWESNPIYAILGGWLPTLLVKGAATVVVAWILERVPRWPPLVWVVPAIVLLPVMWNIVVMAAELALIYGV